MPDIRTTTGFPVASTTSKRRVVAALAAVLALPMLLAACVTGPDPVAASKLETRDWEVPPTASYREADYHAPTPLSIPGARTVATDELNGLLLTESNRPLVIDVIGGDSAKTVRTLPGAIWLPGGGIAGPRFGPDREQRFADKLASLTAGRTDRPIVFLCLGPECWLSYNASLRAVRLGYSNVLWYRGGHEAWRLAGHSFAEVLAEPW